MKNLFNVALKKKTNIKYTVIHGSGGGGPGGGRKSRPCTQGAEIWPVKKSGELTPGDSGLVAEKSQNFVTKNTQTN